MPSQNSSIKPPPNHIDVPLIHKLNEFYKGVYLVGSKISKRDKLGIHARVENTCLELFTLIIRAKFESRSSKHEYLSLARTLIEVLKRLIRIENDIDIINLNQYIKLESDLQEISKMTNGWIKFLCQERPL